MRPKVYFLCPHLSLNVWRSEWPAADLERRGWETRVIDRHTPQLIREKLDYYLDRRTVAVLHGTNQIQAGFVNLVRNLKSRCRAVVLQFDDDYFAHSAIQANPIALQSQMQDEIREACHLADAVVATTPECLDAYRPHAGGRCVVVPNRLPEAVSEIRGGTLSRRIYWMAMLADAPETLMPHVLDFEELRSHLNGHPITVLGGGKMTRTFIPGARWSSPEMPEIRLPGRRRGRLYHRLAEAWVSMAPLMRHEWNTAKSWIKPLESAAVGVPCVASAACPDYVRLAALVPIDVAETPAEMAKSLDAWMGTSFGARERQGELLRSYARGQSIERMSEWPSLIESL